jgi:hypothetical protein
MFSLSEQVDDENDLPSYSTPGRILFRLIGSNEPAIKWTNVDPLDNDGSTLWIAEGMGIDFWVEAHLDLDTQLDGYYVVEGITGTYHRGTWGFDDDHEEWSFNLVRRASPEEIETETLDNEEGSHG